jgi:FkbM family methyltransferase
VKVALSDFEGKMKLFLSDLTDHSNAIKRSTKYIVCPVTTLDNLLKKLNITTVDLIKLDVEGAEEEVLKGAEKP